jgi:hypothetical protein
LVGEENMEADDSPEEESDIIPWRDTLPAFKPKTTMNIFKILKDCIGKDLSKFCVPVYFNEPISMLQKVAEMFEN